MIRYAKLNKKAEPTSNLEIRFKQKISDIYKHIEDLRKELAWYEAMATKTENYNTQMVNFLSKLDEAMMDVLAVARMEK